MRIEFLGTGTSQGVPVIGCTCAVCKSTDPYDTRTRSSVWVRIGDRSILIDAGPDLRQQALRSGIVRLDATLLTHEHMDHIAGIDELRAFNFTQRAPMPLYGTAETLKAVERVYHYAFSDTKYPGVPELELHRIDTNAFRILDVNIQPVEVMHMLMSVLGFRIDGFTYITDAKTISEQQLERVKGTKVLVLNALRKTEHPSHLNVDEALEWIARIQPEKAYLTHISHLMGKHEEVEKSLPEGVHLAFDGAIIELPDPPSDPKARR